MIPNFRAFYENEMRDVLRLSFEEKRVKLGNVGFLPTKYVNLDDVILMQSTCLKDKSGVEIFDGDVVAYFDNDEQISENVIIRYGKHTDEASVFEEKPKHIGFYVEATKGTATFDVINMYEDFKEDIKVIGNIWEDGDLIDNKNPETN